jgi:hypothetical protein
MSDKTTNPHPNIRIRSTEVTEPVRWSHIRAAQTGNPQSGADPSPNAFTPPASPALPPGTPRPSG